MLMSSTQKWASGPPVQIRPNGLHSQLVKLLEDDFHGTALIYTNQGFGPWSLPLRAYNLISYMT